MNRQNYGQQQQTESLDIQYTCMYVYCWKKSNVFKASETDKRVF